MPDNRGKVMGSGAAGGHKDPQELQGSDAAAAAQVARELAAGRVGGLGGASVDLDRAEILQAVAAGRLSRSEAEGRLTELLSKEDRKRGGHLFRTQHTERHLMDAREAIEKRLAEEAVRAQDPEAILKKYAVWLRCRRAQLHQGIFLLKDPRGIVLGPEDWIADYRRETKLVWRGEIICQECLSEGVEERLPYEWQDYQKGTFIPNPRHVWKTPRDYATFELEGHTRLGRLRNEAANFELNRIEREIDAREGLARANEVVRHG